MSNESCNLTLKLHCNSLNYAIIMQKYWPRNIVIHLQWKILFSKKKKEFNTHATNANILIMFLKIFYFSTNKKNCIKRMQFVFLSTWLRKYFHNKRTKIHKYAISIYFWIEIYQIVKWMLQKNKYFIFIIIQICIMRNPKVCSILAFIKKIKLLTKLICSTSPTRSPSINYWWIKKISLLWT